MTAVAPIPQNLLLTARSKALIVEPAPALGRILVPMLEELGFDVQLVTAADDALAFPNTSPADLLVTELQVSGISGYHLAAILRRRWQHLRILYLCNDLAPVQVESTSSTALRKPFSRAELTAALARLEMSHD